MFTQTKANSIVEPFGKDLFALEMSFSISVLIKLPLDLEAFQFCAWQARGGLW